MKSHLFFHLKCTLNGTIFISQNVWIIYCKRKFDQTHKRTEERPSLSKHIWKKLIHDSWSRILRVFSNSHLVTRFFFCFFVYISCNKCNICVLCLDLSLHSRIFFHLLFSKIILLTKLSMREEKKLCNHKVKTLKHLWFDISSGRNFSIRWKIHSNIFGEK